MPMEPVGKKIETELRCMWNRYKIDRDHNQLGAAITIREELGRYFVMNADEILKMIHSYNAPLSEGTEPEDYLDRPPF